MMGEMWRLYRHIIFGGAAILLLSFGAVLYVHQSASADRAQQVTSIDAYLSLLALAASDSSFDPVSNNSAYQWRIPATPVPLAVSDVLDGDIITSIIGEDEIEVKLSGHVVLVGHRMSDRSGPILSGLFQFISAQGVSNSQVATLLSKLSFINVIADDHPVSQFQSGVTSLGEPFYLVPSGDKEAPSLMVTQLSDYRDDMLSRMSIIMVVAVISMCLLIWRELRVLDRKRRYFEVITRQIARGRSGLPKGVMDSSGALKELAYSFDSMSSHIQRLLKVQREMINAISHELRTPIARLRFGLEALKDDVDEKDHGTVIALEDDVEELNTLVDEVLTYGKLEEGSLALNFERTSLRQLLNGVLEHNQNLLKHLEVELQLDDDDVVNADPHHLHRALQNLILNASKYANDKIVITYMCDDERWQVDIEDDGPGIPAEDRDKVFIPFQRLDNSRTRASGGYGLGLAIVQRIAFWHGGAVLVDESSMGGAKFSLIWSRSQHQNSLVS